MQIEQAIRQRRTIDQFDTDRTPEVSIINQAIELASLAPNHKLTEPWRFYHLGNETAAEIIQLNTAIVREKKGDAAADQKQMRWQKIPGWLVVTCVQSEDALTQQEDYAACCCAIQNLQLYLWSKDIGVKWTTGPVTRHASIYDILWIDPSAEKIVGLLWYGYSGLVKSPPVAIRQKKLNDILITLP